MAPLVRLARASAAVFTIAALVAGQELRSSGPSPDVVPLGATSVLTLQLDGESRGVVLGTLPKVDGLEISAGKPTQTVESITVDGVTRLAPRTRIEITLDPRRVGTFQLPPFFVDVRGKTLRSEGVSLQVTPDPKASRHAFVEVDVGPGAAWVRQPVEVKVRFGFDAQFLDVAVIQMFRRRLDVPAQVGAPWLNGLQGAKLLPSPDAAGATQSCVVNEEMQTAARVADRDVDGVRHVVFELSRRFLPDEPGTLAFTEPWMRFAYATKFREDFIGGRVPTDRFDAMVAGDRGVVQVRALPEAGRPSAFTGAVGRYSATSSVDGTTLVEGESFRLSLFVRSRNAGTAAGELLASVVPPRLDELDGFHVLGVIRRADAAPGTVRFDYDVVPLRVGLKEIPGIPFAFFDPTPPASYRTIRTRPIPVTVSAGTGARPRMTEVPDDLRPKPGVDDIHGLRRASGAPRAVAEVSPVVVGVAVFGPWLLGLGWLSARRRVSGRTHAEASKRRKAAARVFERRCSDDPKELTAALQDYLAVRLECPRESVVGPDLERRLRARRVPEAVAARTAKMFESLVAVGYGGVRPDRPGHEARELVEAIESALAGEAS